METTVFGKGRKALFKTLLLAGLLSGGGAWGQTTNAPLMQTPLVRTDDYRTTYLSWNADTGGVYQVMSADLLATQGSQGLTWVVRETDCAARGTNAQWVDFGDTRWIPRIFHPVLQPQRFYRVQKMKQATLTPPTVTVQLLQGGSPLPAGTNAIGGNVFLTVSVSLVDTNDQLSSVGVFVDGQKVHSIPAYNSTNYINTTEWPNGLHEIYAVATTVDYAETIPDSDSMTPTNAAHLGIGFSTSKFVILSNYISQFFIANPYFQAGQTQEVLANFDADSYWRLRIVNYQETTVRQYTGQGASLYAAWDGNDQSASPLPYGFYDYIIEARPSEFGPLGAAGAFSFNVVTSSEPDPTAGYRRTPGAMQFSRTNCNVTEDLLIPSLNPTNNSPATTNSGGSPPLLSATVSSELPPEAQKQYPTSLTEALVNGWTSYFLPPPPMPPIRVNGRWYRYEEVYGPLAPVEVQIPLRVQQRFSNGESLATTANSLESGPAAAAWPDATYTTRTPTRAPGSLFFGFAGTVGVAFQGHHPSSPPYFNLPEGGIVSPSRPPYGPIRNASAIANGFAGDMASGGWRTSFLLQNDNFRSIDLVPELGPGSGTSRFARNCNFGFYVGHMTASSDVDPGYGYASVSYIPFYTSTAPLQRYEWVGLPGMDFGDANGSIFSKLRWMALYGCNSLRVVDFDDMWTKFVFPMPPTLRLVLGAEEGVFIHPIFGSRFAANLNGWNDPEGIPMTIPQAWYEAAHAADVETAKSLRYRFIMGTRRMTVVFRDTTQGGSWSTYNDSIWGWYTDVSLDWYDVSIDRVTVYP